MAPRAKPILERFLARSMVDPESGCWQWQGGLMPSGYGRIGLGGANCKSVAAHRWYWEHLHGPVPADRELDHLCRNRACVNPEHLQAVTHQVNVRRGASGLANRTRGAKVTHCPRGHPYDAANTYVDQGGSRVCRACVRDAMRSRRGYKGMGPPGDRTHCPSGHPYDETNTRWYKGRRYCRECGRVAGLNRYHRLRPADLQT